MTDDKGAGEGPYKIRDGFNRGVVGPGIPSGEEEYDLSPRVANMIFNEGRKAERERCLRILRSHPEKCEGVVLGDCLETVIELIGGGQDAK